MLRYTKTTLALVVNVLAISVVTRAASTTLQHTKHRNLALAKTGQEDIKYVSFKTGQPPIKKTGVSSNQELIQQLNFTKLHGNISMSNRLNENFQSIALDADFKDDYMEEHGHDENHQKNVPSVIQIGTKMKSNAKSPSSTGPKSFCEWHPPTYGGVFTQPTCPRSCRCDPQLTMVDCSNHGLSTIIPKGKLPSSTRTLNLSHNQISRACVYLIEAMPRLSHLDLSNNQIVLVCISTFGCAVTVDLSFNQLRSQHFSREKYQGYAYTHNIYLNNNNLGSIPDIFYNKKDGNKTIYQPFNHAQVLDFSFTGLGTAELGDSFGPFRELRVLCLAGNGIPCINETDLLQLEHSKDLEYLDFSVNKINHIETGAFSYVMKLANLSFAGNIFDTDSVVTLFNAIEHLKIGALHIENNKMNLSKTTSRVANQTHMNFTFAQLSSTKLEGLYLDGNVLPFVSQDLFSNLSTLTNLSLDSCKLKEIDQKAFAGLRKLQNLNIGHNKLTNFKMDMFHGLQLKGLNLDLSRNPFECDCQSTKLFFNEMATKGVTFLNFNVSNEYVCASPKYIAGTQVMAFLASCDHHGLPFYAYIIIAIGTVITILAVIVIWYKLRIKRILKDGYQPIGGNNIPNNIQEPLDTSINIYNNVEVCQQCSHRRNMRGDQNEFVYDAFVSYDARDRAWVFHQLLPEMENKHGLHLCISHRDFEVGKAIADNIVDSISLSRKVIFVITNNSIQSEWVEFEMNMALQRLIHRNKNVLVLVILEKLQNDKVPPVLSNLMLTHTYLESPLANSKQLPGFWNKLATTLKQQGHKQTDLTDSNENAGMQNQNTGIQSQNADVLA